MILRSCNCTKLHSNESKIDGFRETASFILTQLYQFDTDPEIQLVKENTVREGEGVSSNLGRTVGHVVKQRKCFTKNTDKSAYNSKCVW